MNYYAYPANGVELNAASYSYNLGYQYVGQWSNLDSLQSVGGAYQCSLPGYSGTAYCGTMVIVFQGYFFAPVAGTYTFSTPSYIDNALGVWSGTTAYNSFTNSNADYTAYGYTSHDTAATSSYNLAAGEFMPVTVIWSNTGGPGGIWLTVSGPSGSALSTAGWFVPPCSSGSPFAA